MKKTLTLFTILAASLVLTGCQQQAIKTMAFAMNIMIVVSIFALIGAVVTKNETGIGLSVTVIIGTYLFAYFYDDLAIKYFFVFSNLIQ